VRGVLSTLVNRSLPSHGVRRGLGLLALAVFLAAPGMLRAAPVDISADPAVTRGPAGAPVTIVEFSDYQ
jgi:protein-disulfide isomerase